MEVNVTRDSPELTTWTSNVKRLSGKNQFCGKSEPIFAKGNDAKIREGLVNQLSLMCTKVPRNFRKNP
jgi:hypothetical protein